MNVDVMLYEAIKELGINLLLTLPDNMIQGLLKIVNERNEIREVSITREEEGIGVAAGAYLGGIKPAIIMQNSGLGNSINAIKSLLHLYKIPILLIMSHRGTEREKIAAQIPMGKITLELLECINVKTFVIETVENIENLNKAMIYIKETGESVAVVLECTLWGDKS
jgi:sulfopyruvate decarboxylase subunit alpha